MTIKHDNEKAAYPEFKATEKTVSVSRDRNGEIYITVGGVIIYLTDAMAGALREGLAWYLSARFQRK